MKSEVYVRLTTDDLIDVLYDYSPEEFAGIVDRVLSDVSDWDYLKALKVVVVNWLKEMEADA